MKAIHYLIFSLVLVLLTTGTYYLSKPTLTYTGALYLMTIDTPKSPPGLLYGWPVNGSLLQIDSRTSLRFLGARGNQFMEQRLWDNMPTLPFSISDPNNAMVLCSTGPSYQEYFIVINGTKLPFLGGLNQTMNFGIDPDKIAHTTKAYTDTIPTSQYWLG